ncbi:cytochrome P450 6k1-like isoform X2 [Schistocerca nitens]|uniref:cytochrome P450 6k1-like isoform X1 n=1 Tax=Schistocerca nitens TaxID=7011 RepID=UPI00211882B9|nr:cytochrome P450 6k1-like isoform X1 [Schistocerca nitens]XP_049815620.1 cytochrome P450 6k1-like isoform X2 [Schistocerca nitens]
MALLLDSWIAELVVVLSAAVLALYLWFSSAYSYWKRKGVPYAEPTAPFGNFRRTFLGQEPVGVTLMKIHNQLPRERYVGFYGFRRPLLLVRDPELIRHILVKDFGTFHDRGLFIDDEEPLNKHLFALGGKKWRQLRIKLSPTFTSGKLKGMFKTIQDCGREMADVVGKMVDHGESVEVRELIARFTTDVISSVAFGQECNCQRNPDHEFRQWGRKIFEPSARSAIGFLLIFLSPTLMNYLRVKGGTTDVSRYFQQMVADTVAYREKNNYSRKDFMDLLIQLKNKGYVDPDKGETMENGHQNGVGTPDKLSMDDLAAQAFVFFIAGFETSSTATSFTLHELALNPDVQSKLHDEIDTVLKESNGEISYDTIGKMTYLDKVVSESLRKYPPVPFLNRECNQDYKIPDSDVILEKGTPVALSVLGLHYEPKYFPDPDRFDPERFSEEAKARRHPYVYLPFGEGPRICIGMRMGLLQTKVGLVNLLSKYSVQPTQKTVAKLDFHPRSGILMTKSGIHIQFVKRS